MGFLSSEIVSKVTSLLGADVGTRTRDLILTKDVLYLLSYISVQQK